MQVLPVTDAPTPAPNRALSDARPALLAGYISEPELAAELGCHPRTIRRMRLPYLKVRNVRHYEILRCRKVLAARTVDPNAAPRPGRPRKQQAA